MTSFISGRQDKSWETDEFFLTRIKWHFSPAAFTKERLCKFSHRSSHPWVDPALPIHFTYVSKTLTLTIIWEIDEKFNINIVGRIWSCVHWHLQSETIRSQHAEICGVFTSSTFMEGIFFWTDIFIIVGQIFVQIFKCGWMHQYGVTLWI